MEPLGILCQYSALKQQRFRLRGPIACCSQFGTRREAFSEPQRKSGLASSRPRDPTIYVLLYQGPRLSLHPGVVEDLGHTRKTETQR